jgi:hypothetical protein
MVLPVETLKNHLLQNGKKNPHNLAAFIMQITGALERALGGTRKIPDAVIHPLGVITFD